MTKLATFALATAVAGCVPSAMIVPQSQQAQPAEPRFGPLVVAPLTGYGNSLTDKMTGEARSATNERDALIQSLHNSGLFGAVSKEGSAPYLLHAEVTQRDMAGYGATVTVHYVLTATAAGREVCNDSFTTSYAYQGGPSVFFAPGAAQNGALAHALEENYSAFIARLTTLSAPAR